MSTAGVIQKCALLLDRFPKMDSSDVVHRAFLLFDRFPKITNTSSEKVSQGFFLFLGRFFFDALICWAIYEYCDGKYMTYQANPTSLRRDPVQIRAAEILSGSHREDHLGPGEDMGRGRTVQAVVPREAGRDHPGRAG